MRCLLCDSWRHVAATHAHLSALAFSAAEEVMQSTAHSDSDSTLDSAYTGSPLVSPDTGADRLKLTHDRAPDCGDGFIFGRYHLRASQRLLERDGLPVRLGGRALDILIALAERAPNVVDTRELMKTRRDRSPAQSSSPREGICVTLPCPSSLLTVLTSAFARYGKNIKPGVPHAIHKVSKISSDLRGSDRCRFDILASLCAGTKCFADLQPIPARHSSGRFGFGDSQGPPGG
jgi:hypothetical protein